MMARDQPAQPRAVHHGAGARHLARRQLVIFSTASVTTSTGLVTTTTTTASGAT
jgi:hypothetical protein